MKILVVEDEEAIREVIRTYLQRAGFEVEEAASGEVATLKFNTGVHLVILDLNLPHMDGLDVCRAIRKKSATVPILMVTARAEESDELIGLAQGADDYIKKPFSPKVLISRVHALLRRSQASPVHAGALALDEQRMTVVKHGKAIPLTTTQFNILRTLMRHAGKVFSRNELLRATDEEQRLQAAMERTVDAHIKTIRKMVEDDPQHPQYIKTVIGSGYKYGE
ncbi:MAG: response regulator transcription factor [Patescibacteria group bacterium]|jgi:DNA-binding response OmpR family regulator